jgi:hypothetical protein
VSRLESPKQPQRENQKTEGWLVNQETFSIPKTLRARPVAELPLSPALWEALRKMRVQSLGELHGLPVREFGRKKPGRAQLLKELEELIAQAGPKMGGSAAAGQPRAELPSSARAKPEAQAGAMTGGALSPPQPAPPVVKPAAGEPGAVRRSRGVGVQVSPPPSEPIPESFAVPPQAREIRLSHLPMSVRLDGVMRRCGFVRLGDLEGVGARDLRELKNCGRITLRELRTLLNRVAAGEFASPEPSSLQFPPVDLLPLLDGLLAQLPARDEQVVILRLGGEEAKKLTLQQIATEHGLTRERVRQIMEERGAQLRRAGGPRFAALLSRVVEHCRQAVCPLTPALLSQWLEQQPRKHRFALAFYVRALGQLAPELPAWPEGQSGKAGLLGRARTVVKALARCLTVQPGPFRLKDAYEQLRQQANLHKLEVKEFLEALRQSRKIVVSFEAPGQPEAQLRLRKAEPLPGGPGR